MSIFATALSLDADDHAEDCARWVSLTEGDPEPSRVMVCDERRWGYDPTKPCTCACGPLRYVASHILPTDDGPRAGFVSLCEIPGFISRPDRRLCGPDDECTEADCCRRVWPWLRLWVWDGREPRHRWPFRSRREFVGCPVLLDRDQVEQVHAYLGRWLERAGEAT